MLTGNFTGRILRCAGGEAVGGIFVTSADSYVHLRSDIDSKEITESTNGTRPGWLPEG